MVSTFEGPQNSNINDWPTINSSIPGGIYFVPDWTSLGPGGFSTDLVDGACKHARSDRMIIFLVQTLNDLLHSLMEHVARWTKQHQHVKRRGLDERPHACGQELYDGYVSESQFPT